MSLTSRAFAAFNTLLGVRAEPAKEPAHNRRSMFDGLVNAMSGMGTDLDKATGNEWGIPTTQTKASLEFQFRSSWYANQIVRIPAQDMTREWVTHKGGTPDFIKDMRNAERKLNVRHHITNAIKWSRLYGGGGLILGTADPSDLNDLTKPFDVADTTEGQLRYIRFVDRWRLSGTGDLDRDPQSENFDNPAYYLLAGGDMGGFRIHHSRVIRFGGNELPWQLWTQNARWDDSVLQNTQEAIQQLTAATQAICSMLYDANYDVIGIPGLFEAIGAGQEDNIRKRFQLASSVKSWLRAIIIDKDETYETKQRSFSEIANILERLQINLCGAADVPYTRMFGQSPAGMNATGASDLEMYYSMIKSEQETNLRPKLNVLFECIARSECGGFPDDYDFEFNPLKIESASTLATIQSSNANRDNIYMQAGVITAAQCAENLRADGTYSCISDEDIELIKEMEKAADTQSEATAYPPEKEGFESQDTKRPTEESADPEEGALVKEQQPNTKKEADEDDAPVKKVRAMDSTDAKFWRRKGFTRAQADALAFTAKNLRDGYQDAVTEWVEAVENGEAEEYEAQADLRKRFGNAAVVAFNEALSDGHLEQVRHSKTGQFSSDPQVGLTAAEKEHLKAHADGGNALAQLAMAMHGQGLHNEARVICGALKDVSAPKVAKDGEASATPKAVDDGAADQPREPAGVPEGGQFAGGSGSVGGLTPGVHVGKFSTGKGNSGIEKAVQSAVLKAGLHRALAAHPISKVSVVQQTKAWKDGELKDSNSSGVYHRDAREVQVKATRKEGSWGHEFKPGEIHSMSMAAPTHDEAVARTFLHETAHHLFHQDEKLKAAAQKAFDSHPKETKMVNGKPKEQFAGKRGFSKYAEKSASEYMSEALVAYVYHPAELKAHDPKAFALAKKMVNTRGLKVKQ